jgi:1-acyl-sn-glycerol-3-phosphate acyltransferase
LIRATVRLICRIYFRAEIRGLEKVPKTGPCVLAANHGCFLDPFFLGAFSPRYVYYIMALIYYRSFAHPMFRFFRTMPVDQSAGSLKALRAGTTILAKGDTLGIFPEGRVNDDGRLQKPQTGVVFLAKQSGATVVPVAIKGNREALPRGQWFPAPKKITLIVGTPFTVDRKASKKELAEQTDSLMEELAKLLELPPPPKCAGDDVDANNPT